MQNTLLPKIQKSDFIRPFSRYGLNDFDGLHRSMDQAFNRMFGDWNLNSSGMETWFEPHSDLETFDSHYILNVDLPGVPKDKISVEVVDGQLLIRGERNDKLNDNESLDPTTRSRYGSYMQSLSLPEGVTENNIEAYHENGVLRIAIPRLNKEKRNGKKIGISDKKPSLFDRLFHSTKETIKKANRVA